MMEGTILLLIAAFLAGFLDSIAGGGGLIQIPALLLAGIPPKLALGTNKLSSIFGTTTALGNYISSGKVMWRIALIGITFSLIGAILGTMSIISLNEETVKLIILVLLPISSITLFLPRNSIKTPRLWAIPIICLLIGYYDGFFGPGTGTFLALSFHLFLGLSLLSATATSKVFNVISNIGAVITFTYNNQIQFSIGIPMAIFNLLGGFIGSKIALKKGDKFIKTFIIIVFVILFLTLIFSS